MKFKKKDLYANAEDVNLEKRFWWEKLPILKHLGTKRAISKLYDPAVPLILNHLGLVVEDDGEYIKLTKKKK